MGCNCGGVKAGATVVWKWLSPAGPKVFASQAEAEIARSRGGGGGPILKDLQPSA